MAAQQLEEAAREISSMDEMKKEIVYNLGLIYERMGERNKSIAAMKQIYQAEYGYRDVAARVEGSYERQGPVVRRGRTRSNSLLGKERRSCNARMPG